MTHEFSRRHFINLLGKVGGASAAYRSMIAMGLIATPSAYKGPPALSPGDGTRVVILGAGIAGMVAAYELRKAGYSCVILEARNRPGGRNWTLRGGDVLPETGSKVRWAAGDHMYFNSGPARIPSQHEAILSYCRELNVALEVICNDNRNAYLQDDQAFGGSRQVARSVINDSRGYVAELAAKAVDQAGLDQPVTTEDKERLRDFLKQFGALDEDFVYRGSSRSGYAVPPGAGNQSGSPTQPLDLRQLLNSDFWHGPKLGSQTAWKMFFGEIFNMQASMLQPMGGMDCLANAFGRRLRGIIRYNAEVISISRSSTGARIVWRDLKRLDHEQTTEAQYVICTIPFPVLQNIRADLSTQVKQAIEMVSIVPAGKVAFQAERRFWEIDDQIYGGISWTSRDITQMWYPSAGLGRKNGILVGAYIWDDEPGQAFAQKMPAQRLSDALNDAERLHPGCGIHLSNGVSVAWPLVRFSGLAWAEWTTQARAQYYNMLLEGDAPIFFAGEHMSYINGWQEGAALSAHYVIEQISQRVREKRI